MARKSAKSKLQSARITELELKLAASQRELGDLKSAMSSAKERHFNEHAWTVRRQLQGWWSVERATECRILGMLSFDRWSEVSHRLFGQWEQPPVETPLGQGRWGIINIGDSDVPFPLPPQRAAMSTYLDQVRQKHKVHISEDGGSIADFKTNMTMGLCDLPLASLLEVQSKTGVQ